MNSRERVNHYLTLLESRLRWQVILKGAAIALGVALGATIALVLITNALAFSSTSLLWARIVLFISLSIALGMALVLPLLALNRRRTAGRAEQAFPQFQERLVTYVERAGQNDPMLELLAADTEEMTRRATPETIIPKKKTFGFATAAGAAGAVLIWLIWRVRGFSAMSFAVVGRARLEPADRASTILMSTQATSWCGRRSTRILRRSDRLPVSCGSVDGSL